MAFTLTSKYSLTITMCLCFGYSVLDILFMEPKDCMFTMRGWLMGTYLIVMALQIALAIGQSYSPAGKQFIFSFRQKSWLLKAVVLSIWCAIIPFFALWTGFGTMRFRDTYTWIAATDCAYEEVHFWLVAFWQLLSYLWVGGYLIYFSLACLIEYRVWVAERNLCLVQTEESRSRWGQQATGIRDDSPITQALLLGAKRGLQPKEIQALPCMEITEEAVMRDMQCPICLCDFEAHETVRCLPNCGHYFHQSCVDIWLLRGDDCPLCKVSVRQRPAV